MRKCTLIAVSSVLALIRIASAAEPAIGLSVATDRPDSIYAAGDKVKFTVTLKKAGKIEGEDEVAWTVSKDGVPPVVQGKVKLSGGTGTFEASLAEPGFLLCRVTLGNGDKAPVAAMIGAAVDPTRIPPSLPVPDDFDAFWVAQREKLKAIEFKPALTDVKSQIDGIEAFDVQIPCAGPRPVSGYFARPKGAAPRSLPAILSVHGAGVRSSSLGSAVGAAKSYIALSMDINAHGIPNGKPDAFYKELEKGELAGYRQRGHDDREQTYFLGMFLRLMRAMDFLMAQPEWDGKVLIVRGSSQGGGQSIAAAGLEPRVTFIAAGVPAICDHSGKAVGRINGWPKLVPDVDGKPNPKSLQAARYFDCMNFATRAKTRTALLSVGFIDTTCPPSSVYATYNNFPGKKEMINEPAMGHAQSPAFNKRTDELIKAHLAEMKK